jgi:putative DNA methylase
VTYKPKLIEVALPLMAINAESAREKSIRHGHPSTLHLWWARRPLAAARAVIWSSLVDDPSSDPSLSPEEQEAERERLFGILERLIVWENAGDSHVLAEAKAEIDRCYREGPPPVLDPFGGGGAIPLEAQRLGLEALSGDLNPVAVLIQKAMIEIPPRFARKPPVSRVGSDALVASWPGAHGLAADVEYYADWVRSKALERVGHLFPHVTGASGTQETPIAWLWARTIESPDPTWSGQVPLVKSWVLRKKSGKPTIWVEPIVDRASQTITYRVRSGGQPIEPTVQKSGAVCIATGAAIPFDLIRKAGQVNELGLTMLAVVTESDSGRGYRDATQEDVEAANIGMPDRGPRGRLPEGGLGFRIQRYGFTEWAQMFTARQAVVLRTFADLLDEVQEQVLADADRADWLTNSNVPLRDGGDGARAYSEAIATYLAFVLDRCTPRWCAFTAWHNGRETVEQVFRRQAISMNWDFPEVNPFSDSTGNWSGQVEWVTKALEQLPATGLAVAVQRDASARVQEVGSCVVSTDPPYYDNVGYADLSDFFYVWLREGLSKVWPEELATLLAPKAQELIADASRHGSKAGAIKHFESGMRKFFEAVAAAQVESCPATIFYAFKQAETTDEGRSSTGWETFLQGLLDSGLAVTATWPIRTEMTGGLRHVGRNSLASSVVLACRPRGPQAVFETRGGFVAALRSEMPEALRLLQSQNIAPVDFAQSAIGPGMRIFTRYSQVVESDGSAMSVRAALQQINEVLGEVLSSEEADLDADSRFALTWFEQFGYSAAAFGEADVLARAKNTSVEGVIDAGIATRESTGVRLLRRDELDPNWSPSADRRRTDWEAVQHLVSALEQSESSAAALLNELGGLGERARQLAYLLYAVCDRNGWASEAGAYNGLIAAWPTLRASQVGSGDGQQAMDLS